jgi:hypothetical protein
MQKIIFSIAAVASIAIILFVIFGRDAMFVQGDQIQTEDGRTMVRIIDADYGIKFEYREEPDGYVLEENDAPIQEDDQFLTSYMLTDKVAYQELKESTEPREGPPTIQINIFDNPDGIEGRVWAEENNQYSNINLSSSTIRNSSFNDLRVIKYRTDGLYPADVVLVPFNNRIYILSGQFTDRQDEIRDDFKEILDSIEFFTTE